MRFYLFSQVSKLASLVVGAAFLAGCNLQLVNINQSPEAINVFGVKKNYIQVESRPEYIVFNQKLHYALATSNYTVVDSTIAQYELDNIIDSISTDNYVSYLTQKLGKLSYADYQLIAQQVKYNRSLGQSLREKYKRDPFNFGDFFNNVQTNDIPSVYRNKQVDPRDYQSFFNKEYGAEDTVKKLATSDATLNTNKSLSSNDNSNNGNTNNATSTISTNTRSWEEFQLSPAAKLIQTQNNQASFIPKIETCRIDYTYNCVANFLPKLTITNLREDKRSLSLLPNTSITAQGVLIFAVTGQISSKYFPTIDISATSQDLYINTEYAPLANINRENFTRNASYLDISEKLINKIQYILRQPEISVRLFENYNTDK